MHQYTVLLALGFLRTVAAASNAAGSSTQPHARAWDEDLHERESTNTYARSLRARINEGEEPRLKARGRKPFDGEKVLRNKAKIKLSIPRKKASSSKKAKSQ
ncbi:unnamed protein product [Clonostachys solani]|uniref:Uncharacterized protein n=1 Tax=Clonostachys solani TaxID=160281 RepID=A0A9N9ZEG1_9HYPO|nr:unnamed protein product [Clonostachys solani]